MLESLDLSRNKFSCKISRSMSGLHFLGHLDLSNSFSGRILSGTWLQGFNSSAYGNIGLCGPPSLKDVPEMRQLADEDQPTF
ncbi:hypothetical protein DCAR_0208355 [Daucus carota subsp. sativus]|uniref:Uncharacterized protein n=1 Tax=Daucus carota subsp. sativus TaxID=79200 RepID=A0A166EHC0_DAUCS|nr:hypothetical protein DCAR_0208355 [Daucus carota subsp. sativus]